MNEETRKCKICGAEFTPIRRNQVCCSDACKYEKIMRCNKKRSKERYATDEEFRTRKIEQAKKWNEKTYNRDEEGKAKLREKARRAYYRRKQKIQESL